MYKWLLYVSAHPRFWSVKYSWVLTQENTVLVELCRYKHLAIQKYYQCTTVEYCYSAPTWKFAFPLFRDDWAFLVPIVSAPLVLALACLIMLAFMHVGMTMCTRMLCYQLLIVNHHTHHRLIIVRKEKEDQLKQVLVCGGDEKCRHLNNGREAMSSSVAIIATLGFGVVLPMGGVLASCILNYAFLLQVYCRPKLTLIPQNLILCACEHSAVYYSFNCLS